MKYRSLLLHTCFCIGFECLNLNLCLNSFDWVVFQTRKPFHFSYFLPSHVWSVFGLSPVSPKSADAPSTSGPEHCNPPHRRRCRSLSTRWRPSRPSATLHRGRRPQPPTGGPRPSSPTSGRRSTGAGPNPEPVVRTSVAASPHA
jgi:hypothetical protein